MVDIYTIYCYNKYYLASASTLKSTSRNENKMGVSLDKLQREAPHMVNLVKAVEKASFAKGLDPNKSPAAVVATFDSSPSNEMGRNKNYTSGLMGKVGDLVLAAGYTFDDDGKVPVSYFNNTVHSIGDIEPQQSQGLVDRTYRQNWGGGTSYMSALRWIVESVDEFKHIDLGRPNDPLEVKFAAPYPVFAIFVTDGEPTDSKLEIIEYIKRISQLPIFIQFVGVGIENDFAFLKSLNNLKSGRLIDNCGFFNAMEVLGQKKKRFGGLGGTSVLTPEQEQDAVLDALLNEFPDYYVEAPKLGLIV